MVIRSPICGEIFDDMGAYKAHMRDLAFIAWERRKSMNPDDAKEDIRVERELRRNIAAARKEIFAGKTVDEILELADKHWPLAMRSSALELDSRRGLGIPKIIGRSDAAGLDRYKRHWQVNVDRHPIEGAYLEGQGWNETIEVLIPHPRAVPFMRALCTLGLSVTEYTFTDRRQNAFVFIVEVSLMGRDFAPMMMEHVLTTDAAF